MFDSAPSLVRSSRLLVFGLTCALSALACTPSAPEQEKGDLGTTRQAAAPVTAQNPSEAPVWPTDAQWIPLMKGSAALYDIIKDKSNDADVVGDATHASIYVYSDATHFYWRLRMNANPAPGYPNFNNSGLWVCLINTDTDYGTYEWLTWVNGKGTVDTTEVWKNASTTSYDSPSDSPETLVSALNITNSAFSHARVVDTATTSSPSSFPTNSADADYFVDAAFDLSAFSGTITPSTPLRLACGTSATSQGLNADFTSPVAGTTTLSALYTDPMTCGPTGCPVCNTANACGNTCAACSGSTPVCTSGACAACDGDYGTGTTNACSSSSSPFCAANGSCTTCATNADCTAPGKTHGGSTCTSGACVSTCASDADCSSTQWCSTATNQCVAKLTNGSAIPSQPTHMPALNGSCTASAGSAVCVSGVCDSDGKCGYANKTQTCTPANAALVCRSGNCGTSSNVCLDASSCAADGDCSTGNYCDGASCTPKLANGVSTSTDTIHTGSCPALGVECQSGVCDASDGKCGYVNGGGSCTSGNGSTVCRSGSCGTSGQCGCASDSDCASSEFCSASTSSCTTKLANGVATVADAIHTAGCPTVGAAECQSGTCGSASNVCLAAGACAADGDCAAGNYCNGAICTAKLANGVATTSDPLHTAGCPAIGAAECQSGVCDATDSKCGYALGNGSCTSANASTVCRNGACGSGGKCGCAADSECASGEFCNGTACVTKLANGQATSTDAIHTGSCPSLGAFECASGTCDGDGKCGLANGSGTCSSANASSVCRSGACGSASHVCLIAGSCAADADCAATSYCDGSTCVPKKANGVATITDALHTGTCPALGVECTSGVCDANDGKCGFPIATGSCDGSNSALVCRTGVCAPSTAQCGCAADADCSASEYCNANTALCVAKLANDTATTTDSIHSAGCPTIGAAECTAGTCSSADSKCGYPLGGTCNSANASTVCRSSTCGSASLACIPSGGGGCWTDGDCLSSQFCAADHSCVAKLTNGQPIPSTGGHDGLCNATNAAALCASGACDPSDNLCGIGLEHGTCASNAQCTEGLCVLSGTNAGRCEPCLNDASCSGPAPACNTTTNHCVACTAESHDLCTDATPLCNTTTNACVGCSADASATAAGACPSTSAPFCTAGGACGKCAANADCQGHAGGAFCDLTTGSCGAGCSVDADCKTTEICSNPTAAPVSGACVPKVANDELVPGGFLVDGTCTASVGSRVCLSGVCDDQRCGLPNRTACASADKCRSGVCNADGKCGDPNGSSCTLAATCRSNECAADGKCGIANGDACADDVTCRSGACVHGTCGLFNGQACAVERPDACRSLVCFADSACGLPNGQACTDADVCRGGGCFRGRCEAKCAVDADCGTDFFCQSAIAHCAPARGNGVVCVRAAECASGVCNTDGKCGDPDGVACSNASTCRNGSCLAGKCSSALDQGQPCSVNASCKSGVCAADGKCGVPRGEACASPSQCRDGACDATGTCVQSCAADSECPATSWCNAGACAKDSPSGNACTRDAQCESGRCGGDGLCGAKNGEVCSSDIECRFGACDPSTQRCGYENGTGPCTTANASTTCNSRACAADGKCGLPNGGPACTSDSECRGASCDPTSHTCVQCKTDSACAATEACNAGNCVLKLANGLGCTRKAECGSNVCGADGRCGKPDGETCGSANECRSALCTRGLCGANAPEPTADAGAPPAKEDAGVDAGTDASEPLPKPLATVPSGTDAGGAEAPAADPREADSLQGGGGVSCASSPRSSEGGLEAFAMFALVVGGFIRRRRARQTSI